MVLRRLPSCPSAAFSMIGYLVNVSPEFEEHAVEKDVGFKLHETLESVSRNLQDRERASSSSERDMRHLIITEGAKL